MEKSFHNVGELSANVRTAIESIVGPLRDDEVLYIAALGAGDASTPTRENVAWDELESIIGEMHKHAAQNGISADRIDELIDEETSAVRYGRRE